MPAVMHLRHEVCGLCLCRKCEDELCERKPVQCRLHVRVHVHVWIHTFASYDACEYGLLSSRVRMSMWRTAPLARDRLEAPPSTLSSASLRCMHNVCVCVW